MVPFVASIHDPVLGTRSFRKRNLAPYRPRPDNWVVERAGLGDLETHEARMAADVRADFDVSHYEQRVVRQAAR
ncbi:hypothetical protein [Paraburkholderia kururiensis]|uniref:Uncharacterized protein n=1 Tax=Paraburkholderia kururiensis TaxID=984307 RepID=A0ABZ0WM39_9BURK|nr:hypothetical protein [Paraburkholderia kururiensis]WQD78409.1 hypothetical protein U0042_01455 [Paraburkholderia kururiensis]